MVSIARSGGFWQRIKAVVAHPVEAIRQALTPPPAPPPAPPSVPKPSGSAYAPPEPTAPSGFDWSYVPPEESGIPPSPEDELDSYTYLLMQTGQAGDDYVQAQLWTGWFDMEADSDERVAARQAFFDFLGWGREDFDWDEWRDWYSETAG